MNHYEGLYIFPEELREETLDAAISEAGAEIEKLGGTVASTTRVGRKSFARTMHKKNAGQYALIYFSLDGTKIVDLHASYRLNGSVFRAQFMKSDGKIPSTEEVSVEEGAHAVS